MNKRKTARYPILFVLFFALSISLFSKPARAHKCDFLDRVFFDLSQERQETLMVAMLGGEAVQNYRITFDEEVDSIYSINSITGNILTATPTAAYNAQNGIWTIYWTGGLGTSTIIFDWVYGEESGKCWFKLTVTNVTLPSLSTGNTGTTQEGSISGGVSVNGSTPQVNPSATVGTGDTLRCEFETELTTMRSDQQLMAILCAA